MKNPWLTEVCVNGLTDPADLRAVIACLDTEKTVRQAAQRRLSKLDKTEAAVTKSARNKHGASGLCCQLREKERRRAEMWKALCLNARCVLSAHAVGFATQVAIGDAETSEKPLMGEVQEGK